MDFNASICNHWVVSVSGNETMKEFWKWFLSGFNNEMALAGEIKVGKRECSDFISTDSPLWHDGASRVANTSSNRREDVIAFSFTCSTRSLSRSLAHWALTIRLPRSDDVTVAKRLPSTPTLYNVKANYNKTPNL